MNSKALVMNFIMVFRCVREVDPLVFARKDKKLEYRTVGKGNGATEIFGCRRWIGWNPMDGFTRGGASARAGLREAGAGFRRLSANGEKINLSYLCGNYGSARNYFVRK